MSLGASEFQAALRKGLVCLHPTDSLPGLTCDPENSSALKRLKAIKGDRLEKGFVCLAPDFESAQRYWRPLPKGWREVLQVIWPGPLSVIWRPSEKVPTSLCLGDSVCLRVPSLDDSLDWFQDVLEGLNWPLISTSVNYPSETPEKSWSSASRFVTDLDWGFVPGQNVSLGVGDGRPSTLLKIHENGGFEILREGRVSSSLIQSIWEAYVKPHLS